MATIEFTMPQPAKVVFRGQPRLSFPLAFCGIFSLKAPTTV